MNKILIGSLLTFMLIGCGSGSGTTYVDNGPALPEVPTNGTSIVVSGSESSVTYTNVGNGAILVECGDNCDLDVNEVSKIEEEADCPAGFTWCPIEKKCIPE